MMHATTHSPDELRQISDTLARAATVRGRRWGKTALSTPAPVRHAIPLTATGEEMVRDAYRGSLARGELHDEVSDWFRGETGKYPTPEERRRLWGEWLCSQPAPTEQERANLARIRDFKRLERQRDEHEDQRLRAMGRVLMEAETVEQAEAGLALIDQAGAGLEEARLLAVLSFPEEMRRLMGMPSNADLVAGAQAYADEGGATGMGSLRAAASYLLPSAGDGFTFRPGPMRDTSAYWLCNLDGALRGLNLAGPRRKRRVCWNRDEGVDSLPVSL